MNDPRFDKAINYKTDYISVPVYDEDGEEIGSENVWYEYIPYDAQFVITDHSLDKADIDDFRSALANKYKNKYIEL